MACAGTEPIADRVRFGLGDSGDWVGEATVSARAALARHPWALALMETRTNPGPATLRHHDAMLGSLRAGGFSLSMTAHAYALIDAYVYGFALQEASLPFEGAESAAEVANSIMDGFAGGEYPHLVEFATQYVLQPGTTSEHNSTLALI